MTCFKAPVILQIKCLLWLNMMLHWSVRAATTFVYICICDINWSYTGPIMQASCHTGSYKGRCLYVWGWCEVTPVSHMFRLQTALNNQFQAVFPTRDAVRGNTNAMHIPLWAQTSHPPAGQFSCFIISWGINKLFWFWFVRSSRLKEKGGWS